MQAKASPDPFVPGTGFHVEGFGGTPPYRYDPDLSPPNPEGVTIDLGPPVVVDVPFGTPSDTMVTVTVTDSSEPPESTTASSVVR